MLSILIPVYNFPIKTLVVDLQQQCEACRVKYEILCIDDRSPTPIKIHNQVIKNIDNVRYIELNRNIGRAKIRNLLAKTAQYPFLLFMDCDSRVVQADYIKSYIHHIEVNTLVYGGRVYKQSPPLDKSLDLHYLFGKNREEISYEERKIKPYYSFMTNNFLIPKDLFLKIGFDESIEGYGHEDTLFGIELQKRRIKIKHINNPLEHIGLEKFEDFLSKQKVAIKNLYILSQKEPLLETKLLQTFVCCKKWKIQSLILVILNAFNYKIEQRLRSTHPKLIFLDLYKLRYLLEIDKNGIKNLSS